MNLRAKTSKKYRILAATTLQKVIIDTINDGTCEEIDWDEGKEDCLDENGDTGFFFTFPHALPKGSWLIHFTKAAEAIVKQGFKGAHLDHLGLTRGGGKRLNGDHGLAYRVADADSSKVGREFGNDAILFQSDDAVEASHDADGEKQVIFDATTMKNVHALKKQGKVFNVLDPKTGDVLFTIPDSPNGFVRAAHRLAKKPTLKKTSAAVESNEADAAPPSESLQNQRWYHGTSSQSKAMKIWKQGIKPNLSTATGLGRAVEDMVYVSKNLPYAVHYALGGNVAGSNDKAYIAKLLKRHGQYGYLAVVPGKELQKVHPDEDQIGEAVYDTYKHKSSGWLKRLAEEHLYVDPLDEFHGNLLQQVKAGDYDAWIAAGKILLPHLDDEQKIELIEEYGNVAHEGTLKPSELWRIDRNKIPDLKSDGSNFFQLAEKIK